MQRLNWKIRNFVIKNHENWGFLLNKAAKAYDARTNEKTRLTPYRLFYERDEISQSDISKITTKA